MIFLVGFFFCTSVNRIFGKDINRDVLVLWSSTETQGKDYSYTTVHRNFESIWNYYGYKLHFVEVNYELENDKGYKNPSSYSAVLTFFYDNPIKDYLKYLRFLNRVKDQKVPLIILGEWGFLSKPTITKDKQVVNWFDRLNLNVSYNYYDNPLLFKIKNKTEIVEFERKLENEILNLKYVSSKSTLNKSHLSISVYGEEKDADVVLESENFFYAQRGFEIFVNPMNDTTQWRVNPFYIIEKIVGVIPVVPDVTTHCGRRISFFHIDGDGFINQSEVDRSKISGEIIINNIINKYKFPVTASLVVAEVDEKFFGNKIATQVAKELFRIPFVEPATHTFSHPLSWEMNPDENEKLAYLDDKIFKIHKGPIVAYKINGYVMDYFKEVNESASYIEKELLTDRKQVQVLQWTGSCKPPLMAVEIAEKAGLLHINGGDSRFDKTFPSVAGLSALYRKVGQYTQVYSAAANENIYTNLWRGPFNGFVNVIESFKNTETPRRMKPINVYYHFYSGEKESSLDSLRKIYDWVETQETNSIYTSQYINLVRDFENAKIERISENHFIVNTYGIIRTLRLPFSGKYPDYTKSKNVIGHRVLNDSLYISLGSSKRSEIYLSFNLPSNLYIESCNGTIENIEINKDQVTIRNAYSHVPFEVQLSNGKKVKLNKKRVVDLVLKNDPL
ncbi:MAG: hypothetical protein Fur0010_09410 [Bdellovibrio sp.]